MAAMDKDIVRSSSILEAAGSGLLGAAIDMGIAATPLGANNLFAGLVECIGGAVIGAIAPAGTVRTVITNAGVIPGVMRIGRYGLQIAMGMIGGAKAADAGDTGMGMEEV